jgi:hypothetical protein
MMALIDYKGYRLVAISLLPINNSTLIYGTADAGRTVKSVDQTFNSLMQETAKVSFFFFPSLFLSLFPSLFL